MKNETKIYKNVKEELASLGMNDTEAKEVMNYIKSVKNNASVVPQRRKKQHKDLAISNILKLMKENPKKMFSINDISESLNLHPNIVQLYARELKEANQIKIVGFSANKFGLAKALYQSASSPLKKLKTVTAGRTYASLTVFTKKFRALFDNKASIGEFLERAQKSKLEIYPIATQKGLVKGYRISDLKQLVEKMPKSSQESLEKMPKSSQESVEKMPKSSQKSVEKGSQKRKYTKRTPEIEVPVKTTVEQVPTPEVLVKPVKKSLWGSIKSLFSKKQEKASSDVIAY